MHERSVIDSTSGPFARRIFGIGVALTVLFAVMAPASSAPLTFIPRLLYWALHIGLGLAAVGLAATLLMQHVAGLRDWRFVLLSGLVGVVLFAPIAYGLESLFQVSAGAPDDDWADQFARTSVLAAIAVEAFEMAPSFLAAWVVINFGPFDDALRNLRSIATASAEQDERDSGPVEILSIEPAMSQAAGAPAVRPDEPGNAFLDRLPPAVGRRVLSVSSDLHYLQVITDDGEAMLLGALKELDEAFGDAGLRVHRSHWVHLDAVVRLHKSAGGWQLEMRGGHRVPISRRKRSTVVALLGEDFVRAATAA